MRYYLVYKTTNMVNGKYYIGSHETENKFDSYLGSGTILAKAIKKYGKSVFVRHILFECKSRDAMYKKNMNL